MAVESTITSVVYTVTSASAGQEFPIPFPYIEKAHVVAYYAEDGENTYLTYGTDYTVNSFTLTVTGTLPVGAKFVIQRNTPLTQEIVWVDGQAVYTPDIMQADDKLTFIDQEMKEEINRSLKVDASSSQTPEELMEELFAVREDAAGSASDAAASAALSQAWAESDTSPDPDDADAKSSRSWAAVAKAWAQSDTAPDPDDDDSKSAKTWAGQSATSASAASGSATQSQAWAESDTAPDPNDPTSKSAKSWAAEAATGVPIATTEVAGRVKPDGDTIIITEDGTISAGGGGAMYTEAITDVDVDEVADGIIVVTDEPDDTSDSILGGVPVGTIIWSANAAVPAGYLLCNGSAVGRATYPELFAAIGTAFGSGDGSTTFNLPNLIDKFIEGGNSAGTVKAAGLPNITGQSALIPLQSGTDVDQKTGAIRTVGSGNSSTGGTGTKTGFIYFDAADSSSVYGNSTTVQPPAVTALPCIKAFAAVIGDATVVAGQLVNEIQSKVALDGSNTSSIGSTLSTYMANSAMPSGQYEDLTLPASGGNVTAPADGWITLSAAANAGGWISFSGILAESTFNAPNAGIDRLSICLPCKDNDEITVTYSNLNSSYQTNFRFVYANGSATA